MNLEDLKSKGEAPEWLTEEGFTTMKGGYLWKNETPKEMYLRIAKTSKKYLPKESDTYVYELYSALWNGWICPASPIVANFGTDRGLGISCNILSVDDSLLSIKEKDTELAMLTKYSAGVGINVNNLRSTGSPVKGTGGVSGGVISWARMFDVTSHEVNQGGTRRGAASVNLSIHHPDIEEFIDLRKATGDRKRRVDQLNICVVVDDVFMKSLEEGNEKNRKLWEKLLNERFQNGEPYILFEDNVNSKNPQTYVDKGFHVNYTNICTEIMMYADSQHTVVCCLLSMNLAKWDEWENTNAVQLASTLLDTVLSEYIEKASKIKYFDSAVRFAEKSRAVGIGALGWHTLLQKKMLPFDSFESMMLNAKIFKHIQDKALEASISLAYEYGEPEWCKGYGVRNTHRTAVAPTTTNSILVGGVSPGIEPWAANEISQTTSKGTFVRKNKELEKLLESKEMNTPEVWKEITKNKGSVQTLSCLTDLEKQVFLTAREINQFAIIKQAAQRQQFIDQGQSVNLFFTSASDPKYIHEVHMEAWKQGLKSLYYCRSESVLNADLASRSKDECASCEA